jgi:cytochrome c5
LLQTCLALGVAFAQKPPDAAEAAMPAVSGMQMFEVHCGICHLQMGTGTLTLARRVGWRYALLAEREDLGADYVNYVVRNGIGSMPPQTRVDLSDADLGRIAAYLTRPSSERDPTQPTHERPRHE